MSFSKMDPYMARVGEARRAYEVEMDEARAELEAARDAANTKFREKQRAAAAREKQSIAEARHLRETLQRPRIKGCRTHLPEKA